MTELKSCPFCSGGTKDDHKPGLVASGGLWRVMCGYCDSSTGWRSSPEEAVKVWNKRFVCPDEDGKPVFEGDRVEHDGYEITGVVFWDKIRCEYSIMAEGEDFPLLSTHITLIEDKP